MEYFSIELSGSGHVNRTHNCRKTSGYEPDNPTKGSIRSVVSLGGVEPTIAKLKVW